MAKILVVEDDKELGAVVEDWLTADRYVVEWVLDGKEGMERLRFFEYDAVVLDWGLPGMTGVEILKEFRKNGGATPVLILTGKNEIAQKEQGLDAGADDYLTKPFDPRELSARLRAILRRPAAVLATALKVGDLTLEQDKKRVSRGGKEVQLAAKEFALLEFFMRHPDQIFSQETLLERVWSNDVDTTTDSLRVHINRLRNKLDSEGEPSMICTVHRQGYKLVTPPQSG